MEHLGFSAATGLSAARHMQGVGDQLHLILIAEANGKCEGSKQLGEAATHR